MSSPISRKRYLNVPIEALLILLFDLPVPNSLDGGLRFVIELIHETAIKAHVPLCDDIVVRVGEDFVDATAFEIGDCRLRPQ